MNVISVINLASVGIFGLVLSARFCDILWTRKNKLYMAGCISLIMIIQGIVCLFTSVYIVKYFYPLITHLPLAITLCLLSREFLWPAISVLTAYLCCQLRRWLALLIVSTFSGGELLQHIVETVVTLPLLLLLLRFIAPSVRSISHYTAAKKCQFGLIPLLFYGYDYLTAFYTDLLSAKTSTVMEFMPFMCSLAYLIFVLNISETERIRNRLEQTQDILNLQLAQAIREIGLLRESQQKTRTYRHDLRHHMQYLFSCLENGRTGQAQNYIQEICAEIEASNVIVFCENEATNLILSAFYERAQKNGIAISTNTVIPQDIPIAENDWCVLLSNALENALHACQKLKEKGLFGTIDISAYEKKISYFCRLPIPVRKISPSIVVSRLHPSRSTASACAASAPLWNAITGCTLFPSKTGSSFYASPFKPDSFLLCHRKLHDKLCSLSNCGRNMNSTSHFRHNAMDNIQPKPCTALPVSLPHIESSEDTRQFLLRDTAAGILHRHTNPAILPGSRHRNTSPARRGAKGIVNQVFSKRMFNFSGWADTKTSSLGGSTTK